MVHVGRMLLSIFLLVNTLLAFGCSQNEYSISSIPEAAGRYSSVTSEYPGVVMVISPGGLGLCSGTIVSPHAVLTATHCVRTEGEYTVRTAYSDFYTTQVERNGVGTVDDPQDISLLIFSDTLTIDPSSIYSFANQTNVGDSVALVGFGCNSIEQRSGSGVKREGTNRIAGKSDYLELLTPQANFGTRIIGDSNQAGTCFGDSGGPLFKNQSGRMELVGVTHAGGTYDTYYVSEFTNVADYSPNRLFLSRINREYGLGLGGI